MASVGIRELRQNASQVIRRVVAGEAIEVTQRGQTVARIVPVQPMGELEQMIADGRVTEATGNLLDIHPLPAEPGQPTLSEILMEMRADER